MEPRTFVIAIIPPQPARQRLRDIMEAWSERLGSHKALRLPPHITLVGRFRTQQADEALARVREYASQATPFILRLDQMGHFSKPQMLFVPTPSDDILRMHEALLDIVVDLRDPWTREELDQSARSPRERELLERYGSPYVKEFFAAHMTIAGPDVTDDFEALVGDAQLEEPIAFPVREIAVMEKTERWRVVAWFPFNAA